MNALNQSAFEPAIERLNLDREIRVVKMTKALTDAVAFLGYGAFLYEPEVAHVRARFYERAAIDDWSAWEDRSAASRLRIWFSRVRLEEAAE